MASFFQQLFRQFPEERIRLDDLNLRIGHTGLLRIHRFVICSKEPFKSNRSGGVGRRYKGGEGRNVDSSLTYGGNESGANVAA